MGVANLDKKAKKRKRESLNQSSLEAEANGAEENTASPLKATELAVPQQASAKKGKRKRAESEEVPSPVSKSKKNKELNVETSSVGEPKKKKKGTSKAGSESDSEKIVEKKNENEAPPSKKKKKNKNSSFGVVDKELLEAHGGKVNKGKVADSEEKTRINRAVDYLRQWHNDRKSWKFNKGFQSLLLKAMYNPIILPEDDFAIALLYFEKSAGSAREKLKTDAMALITDDDPTAEPADPDKEKRARNIMQMLG